MHKGLMFARSFGGFHPADTAFRVVSAELARPDIATLDLATEMDAFTNLAGYELLVIYADRGEMSDMQAQALVAWVEAGGALVILHGGMAASAPTPPITTSWAPTSPATRPACPLACARWIAST